MLTPWADTLDRAQPLPEYPPAADGARQLPESQRPVELRDHDERKQARAGRRHDPCALLARERAVRRGTRPAAGGISVVHPHGHAAGRIQRRPRAAALRRGRPDRDRVVQRRGAGHAHGRLPAVHGGHHRGAGQGKHDPCVRARRDEQVPAPARQADAAPARHLVHAAERHLADGLARERAAELHPLPARDAAV